MTSRSRTIRRRTHATLAAGLGAGLVLRAQVRLGYRRFAAASQPPPQVGAFVQPHQPGAGTVPLELVALGDSGMAGVGVDAAEESLPVLLARRLCDRTGRPVHVRSYARAGSRTADVLTEQLPRVQRPVDAVVVMVGNQRRDASDTAAPTGR